MNKERLLRLADLLEENARKPQITLNMNLYGRVEDPFRPISCKTEACALGWAALSGIFEDEGLSYKITPFTKGLIIYYRGASDFSAAMKFFGINQNETVWLFTPVSYLKPSQTWDDYHWDDYQIEKIDEHQVATRIRDFVKHGYIGR